MQNIEESKEKLLNHHLLVYDINKKDENDHYQLTSLPDDYSNVWGYEACVVGQFYLIEPKYLYSFPMYFLLLLNRVCYGK